jgi:hypothetical protein
MFPFIIITEHCWNSLIARNQHYEGEYCHVVLRSTKSVEQADASLSWQMLASVGKAGTPLA